MTNFTVFSRMNEEVRKQTLEKALIICFFSVGYKNLKFKTEKTKDVKEIFLKNYIGKG